MNLKEVAAMYGIEEKDCAMKNKKKANEIMDKILKCHKCGGQMNWIEGTNICVCPTCTYSIGKKENKETYSVSKMIQDRSKRFLENNYKNIDKESEGK